MEKSLAEIFRGVRIMHESSAFALYETKGREQGRVEEIQRILLLQGSERFGAPTSEVEANLRAIQDLDRLERMSKAILKAPSWQELLATP
jgi:hypothetical protein